LETAIAGARVFVSAEDISLGDDWRALLTEALNQSRALLVLCSARSIRRPWINFESGSGWLRGVRVIPVCHSGLRKADLPDPLRAFQILELVDGDDCRKLVESVGAELKLAVPDEYPYDDMMDSLFTLPERGSRIGIVLTHGQEKWEEDTCTVFNAASTLPEPLAG
jgi:TIR domain